VGSCVDEWRAPSINSCQAHDGGIAALPGAEAHGGYAFCALAALTILGETRLLDLPALAVRMCVWID
jgi:protein farnesyltransferase subunit beta